MIKQRILYVGLGGSGLDIGRELTEALTHEICGLDGRRLVARGGPFAGFTRSQLPKFVQSVYFDFSQDALEAVARLYGLPGSCRCCAWMPPTLER